MAGRTIFNRRIVTIDYSKNFNIQQLEGIRTMLKKEIDIINTRIYKIRRKQRWENQ